MYTLCCQCTQYRGFGSSGYDFENSIWNIGCRVVTYHLLLPESNVVLKKNIKRQPSSLVCSYHLEIKISYYSYLQQNGIMDDSWCSTN